LFLLQIQSTTSRSFTGGLSSAVSEPLIVPLSPEESRLLILSWETANRAREIGAEGLHSSHPSENEKSAPKTWLTGRTPSAAPPRSTAEVMARLRHLVARQAAKQRLAASFGRMREPLANSEERLAASFDRMREPLATSDERHSAWRPQNDAGSFDDLLRL
jgi:hypothetical protein